jgi:2-dehydro-3-deoxyphosphogalactonate aldolase
MSGEFARAFGAMPLIAILRGLAPAQAQPAFAALAGTGVTLAEIPLNGPDPLEAIARAAAVEGIVVGAGTVLTAGQVHQAAAAGARYVVAPNFDPAVVGAAAQAGVAALPGVATPTEAFAALAAGAFALKLFPAETIGPAGLKAWRAVLTAPILLLPVGGVGADNLAAWRAAGASGAGIGSALYAPGRTPEELRARARALVSAWRAGSKGAGAPA